MRLGEGTIREDLAALLVDREEQARLDEVLDAEFKRVASEFPSYFEGAGELVLRSIGPDGTVIEVDAGEVVLGLRTKLIKIAKLVYEGQHAAVFDLRDDIKDVLS